MLEEQFSIRLYELRTQKGVSARDMSLSIGQNPGYINNIETGKSLPSMAAFFYICEYLDISPQDFFDTSSKYPVELNDLIKNSKKLSKDQLTHVAAIVSYMIK